MVPDAGGGSTKQSLARTFAVICEGAEGTQEVSSQPGIRGIRFARTMTSDKAQIHAAAHCTRVRHWGRGIRRDSIETPPSEESLPLSFYTRGAERESRQGLAEDSALSGLARVSTLLANCVSAFTACRRRQCIHWSSAYRRGSRTVWGQRSDSGIG